MIVGFIDEHRDEFGVEPICTALQVAPSTLLRGQDAGRSSRRRGRCATR